MPRETRMAAPVSFIRWLGPAEHTQKRLPCFIGFASKINVLQSWNPNMKIPQVALLHDYCNDLASAIENCPVDFVADPIGLSRIGGSDKEKPVTGFHPLLDFPFPFSAGLDLRL